MEKKEKLLLVLTFYVFCSSIFGQNYDKFQKELEKLYGKKLPESFFVVQAYTGLEVFTNAPAIIDRMREISQNQVCPYIFMVWKDNGGIGKNFYYYLKNNYYIDTNQYIKAYLSDEAFKYLKDVPNSEVYYFHKGKMIKKWDGKYGRINEVMPYDVLSIDNKIEYLEWFNDPPYYHQQNSIFSPINDTLAVELFDGQEDRIRLVNLKNGKVLKIAPLYDLIDYIDVYMNVFKNPYNFDKEVILKYDSIHRVIKRTPMRVENVYIKNLNEIYLLSNGSVYGPSPKEFYVPFEYNNDSFMVIKKGTIKNFDFGIILKTDTSFKIKDVIYMPTFDVDTFYANNFILNQSAMVIKDSLFYMPGFKYNHFIHKSYNDLYKDNKNTEFMYVFKREGNILKFYKKEKAKLKYPFELFYRDETFHFFASKKHTFAIVDPFPEIYVDSKEKPVASLVDTSNSKKIKFVNNDPNKEPYPFTLAGKSPILNGKFLLVFYKLDKKLYFKVFDANMNTIQSGTLNVNLPKAAFEKIYYGLSFVTDNYFQVPYCDKKGCFNARIKLKFNDVNPNFNLSNTFIR